MVFFKLFQHRVQRLRTMTDPVFFIEFKFTTGTTMRWYKEDWIIAKTTLTLWSLENAAFPAALCD